MKKQYGKCVICGKYANLTFEHVPPRAAFNKDRVKTYSADELFREENKNRLPWEFEGLKYTNNQRGTGGYYLCAECNSLAGTLYVNDYVHFVECLDYLWHKAYGINSSRISFELKEIRPLAIIKQIMIMFCDINQGLMGEKSLREFILNQNSHTFDKNKFRIFIHLPMGVYERANALSYLIYSNPSVRMFQISELIFHPLGIALYKDLPKEYDVEGAEITHFVDYNYEDKVSGEFCILILECNTSLPKDYRKKEEILKCMHRNRHM